MLNVIIKASYFLFRVFLLTLLVIIIIIILNYIFCPVYKFDRPQPFAGDVIINPYKDFDKSLWKKANFHTHTSWIFNKKEEFKEIRNKYKNFGYEILTFSNYFSVNTHAKDAEEEINAYEHGFNINKFHCQLIGANNVSFYDLLLYTGKSHRYHKMKYLEKKCDILIFCHPSFRTRWLEPEHMRYISYYHFLEAHSNFFDGSLPFYDEALSAGLYSSIMANDDYHEYYSDKHFARNATFVNCKSNNDSDIKEALLSGKSYAVTLPDFEDVNYRLKRNLNLPVLKELDIENDSIKFLISEPATINIFGQNGILRYTMLNTDSIIVPFKKSDTYLRFAAIFDDRVILYANPVYRSLNKTYEFKKIAVVNYPLTVIQTMTEFTLLLISIFLFLKFSIRLMPMRIIRRYARYPFQMFRFNMKRLITYNTKR